MRRESWSSYPGRRSTPGVPRLLPVSLRGEQNCPLLWLTSDARGLGGQLAVHADRRSWEPLSEDATVDMQLTDRQICLRGITLYSPSTLLSLPFAYWNVHVYIYLHISIRPYKQLYIYNHTRHRHKHTKSQVYRFTLFIINFPKAHTPQHLILIKNIFRTSQTSAYYTSSGPNKLLKNK